MRNLVPLIGIPRGDYSRELFGERLSPRCSLLISSASCGRPRVRSSHSILWAQGPAFNSGIPVAIGIPRIPRTLHGHLIYVRRIPLCVPSLLPCNDTGQRAREWSGSV